MRWFHLQLISSSSSSSSSFDLHTLLNFFFSNKFFLSRCLIEFFFFLLFLRCVTRNFYEIVKNNFLSYYTKILSCLSILSRYKKNILDRWIFYWNSMQKFRKKKKIIRASILTNIIFNFIIIFMYLLYKFISILNFLFKIVRNLDENVNGNKFFLTWRIIVTFWQNELSGLEDL